MKLSFTSALGAPYFVKFPKAKISQLIHFIHSDFGTLYYCLSLSLNSMYWVNTLSTGFWNFASLQSTLWSPGHGCRFLPLPVSLPLHTCLSSVCGDLQSFVLTAAFCLCPVMGEVLKLFVTCLHLDFKLNVDCTAT